jgi:hypothetical protein
MRQVSITKTRIGLVMVMSGLAGCGGSPSAPSAQPAASASAALALPLANRPVAEPIGLQPTIAAVAPNVVSTAGTWGTISGAQFHPGATVTIGGTAVSAIFQDSTTLRFANSGAHAVGSVDVTVTNPGGPVATLTRSYTFSPAGSFDPNGEWIAHADGHNDYVTDMRFTIRNNLLISLSCGTPVTMPTTVSVQNGGFSFAGADGLTISGTLASTTTSYGEVNAPGCGDGRWWADKAAPAQF